MNDLAGDCLHILTAYKGDRILNFRFGHLENAHGARQEAIQLPAQREADIALFGHVVANQSRRTDFQLIKIIIAVVGQIRAEDFLQLFCRFQVDVFRRVRQRIRLDINLAQVFVQLGQRQLNGGFHRVGIDRGEVFAGHRPCHAELPPKHGFHQFHQDSILRGELILIAAPCDARFFYDLRDRCVLIALFQKQPDAYG